MRLNFFFADENGHKIEEISFEADLLPREGEIILTAPDATPEYTPLDQQGFRQGTWRVYKIQYLITNHGKLTYPTVYAKHEPNP